MRPYLAYGQAGWQHLHVDLQVADQMRHAVPQVPQHAPAARVRVRVRYPGPARTPQRGPGAVELGARPLEAQQEAEQRRVLAYHAWGEQQVQRPRQAVLEAQVVPGVVGRQVQ